MSHLHTVTATENHEVSGSTRLHCHDVHSLDSAQIQQRLQAADTLCKSQGVRFTPLRRSVYQLTLQAQRPLGAYELIESLQAARRATEGEQAKLVAPPTIYRTLDFLLEMGLVHQISSINAFVPCCYPRDEHNAVFLLCTDCQRVQEYSGLPVQQVVGYVKDEIGFEVTQSVMELKGRCHQCANT